MGLFYFSKLKKVELFKESVVYTKEKSRKQMGESKWNKPFCFWSTFLFLGQLCFNNKNKTI
jgi:hypothetical protein